MADLHIQQFVIQNFKRFLHAEIDFSQFDLLVGPNNCGKSTVLQALSLFNFCLSQTLVAGPGQAAVRLENRGMAQDEFNVIPVASARELWTGRAHQRRGGGIRILLSATFERGFTLSFSIGLTYNRFSIQPTIEGLDDLAQLRNLSIVFVPSFSGLFVKEPFTTPFTRQTLIAQGRLGDVLRNILLDLSQQQRIGPLIEILEEAFEVDLSRIEFDPNSDLFLRCLYDDGPARELDIASGGSGFHQFLQIFSFILLKRPTTVLLDEPDAHLHSNLQRRLLGLLQRIASEQQIQVLVSTHSKELISQVQPRRIISFLEAPPRRLQLAAEVLEAVNSLGSLDNFDLANLVHCRKLVLVEGGFDRSCIESFYRKANDEVSFRRMQSRVVFLRMSGVKKPVNDILDVMQQLSQNGRIEAIFFRDRDYMSDAEVQRLTQRAAAGRYVLHIWQKHEIENFILVPEAIHRCLMRTYADQPLNVPDLQTITTWLGETCEGLRNNDVFDGIAKAILDEARLNDENVDPVEANRRARAYLDQNWNQRSRFSITPGKEILTSFRRRLQEERRLEFGSGDLVHELRAEEMHPNIQAALNLLEQFIARPLA